MKGESLDIIILDDTGNIDLDKIKPTYNKLIKNKTIRNSYTPKPKQISK